MRAAAIPFFLFLLSLFPARQHAQLPYPYTPREPRYRSSHSFFHPDTVFNKKKAAVIGGLFVSTYGGIYSSLALAWYKDTERSRFHWFNDVHEWKLVDKWGHAMGAYQGCRALMGLMKWSGADKKTTLIAGGVSSFLMLSTLEVFDGFSSAWGASGWDLAANFTGSAFAVGNEWLWNEQRIQIKISYHPTNYPLVRDDLLGTKYSKWVKDYNGHTHWLSLRMIAFLPKGSQIQRVWPRWLNIAAGMGAEGMVGGYSDPNSGWRQREFHKYYLGLDIDLTQVRTKIGVVDWLLSTINFIRIPCPAIEFSPYGVKVHGFYF